jgi:hypothetical protein
MKKYEVVGKNFVIDLCTVTNGDCYGPYGSSDPK